MHNIDRVNIFKSLILGAFIGLIILLTQDNTASTSDWFLVISVSGGIGLVIGTITEAITALIPIRLAKTKIYFLINNAIALLSTIIILLLLSLIVDGNDLSRGDWIYTLLWILGIISLANLGDYIYYLKSKKSLDLYKDKLKDKLIDISNEKGE